MAMDEREDRVSDHLKDALELNSNADRRSSGRGDCSGTKRLNPQANHGRFGNRLRVSSSVEWAGTTYLLDAPISPAQDTLRGQRGI